MSSSVRAQALRWTLAAASAMSLTLTAACGIESPQGVGQGPSSVVPPTTTEASGPSEPSPGESSQPPDPTPDPVPTTPRPTSKPAPTSLPPSQPSGQRTPQPSGCAQGDRQREVENYLVQLGGFGELTVDGVQSAADCDAIKKFQQRYGIRPAEGRAGPTTADVARRLASTETGQCQVAAGTTVCVDLSLQTVWVIRDGTVVLGPTVTRTGMRGFRTPAGTFRINFRNVKEWSDPYEVWLPYWQHFYDGMGFHEATTYIHDASIGSHGCVNLLHADAVKLWELAQVGTRVYLFGVRPGT